MIEKTLLDFLNASGLPTYMETPEDFPGGAFVVLERVGGTDENQIKIATIAIQSYGRTLLEAAETNETVKNTIKDFAALPSVCKASLNSDYNYTDTATKRYRYQAVFNITHY